MENISSEPKPIVRVDTDTAAVCVEDSEVEDELYSGSILHIVIRLPLAE